MHSNPVASTMAGGRRFAAPRRRDQGLSGRGREGQEECHGHVLGVRRQSPRGLRPLGVRRADRPRRDGGGSRQGAVSSSNSPTVSSMPPARVSSGSEEWTHRLLEQKRGLVEHVADRCVSVEPHPRRVRTPHRRSTGSELPGARRRPHRGRMPWTRFHRTGSRIRPRRPHAVREAPASRATGGMSHSLLNLL